MRIVRRRQDRLLLAELAEVRAERHRMRTTGTPPSLTLVNYELGLRTAGAMLGVVEWGESIMPARRLWRFYRIDRAASRWQTWKARWWR